MNVRWFYSLMTDLKTTLTGKSIHSGSIESKRTRRAMRDLDAGPVLRMWRD
jgi:hypothetical protein